MKEKGKAHYYIHVGILGAPAVSFCLNGRYSLNGVEVTGEGRVDISDGRLQYKGTVSDSIEFVATDDECTFDLDNVVIGVDFHWQRCEKQRFEGNLRFIVADGQVHAVNDIDIERYLYSVISSEMSGESPFELLKAHAIISRSWLMAQIRNKGVNYPAPPCDLSQEEIISWMDREDHEAFDVCADDHCQRYQGITRAGNPEVARAIEATRGIVILDDDGKVADARFSKCCGGVTELFENCWQPEHHSYLVARADTPDSSAFPDLTIEQNAREWIMSSPGSFCNSEDAAVLSTVLNGYDRETTHFYRWTVKYSAGELAALISRRSGINFGRIRALEVMERGPSGRIIRLRIIGEHRTVTIGKELIIRRWLSDSHLYSSAFIVEHETDGADGYPLSFTLHGAGWGHGVGLCQIGAAVMATKGYEAEKILSHYFPNTQLVADYGAKK